MKTQEKIKNDEINIHTDTLADLPVADEQAEETRGGTAGHVKVFSGATLDRSGDKFDDIIVGAGPGGGPHVK